MGRLNVLSLFTGAGGLDLGLEAAGFDVAGCVERDADCRKTVEDNTDWQLSEQREITTLSPVALLNELGLVSGEITLLAGGPPCQPFSKSGQWVSGRTARMADPRANTLRKYFEILEAALPAVMVLENVKGLVAEPRAGSQEEEALDLLHTTLADVNFRNGTSYTPSVWHVDAADFGVPQKRERVFVLASREGGTFVPPASMRGGESQFRRAIAWDVLGELDDETWDPGLALTGKWAGLLASIPEGRNYAHHTRRGDGVPIFGWRTKYWSFLLKLAKSIPSWTIQAQAGPATGPFHWRSRQLSVRELARLQTFPDRHVFSGTERAQRRQIGNAVPVTLAEVLGVEIRRQLLGDGSDRQLTTAPQLRSDCPPAEEAGAVPEQYLNLVGYHEDHPGTGEGPGAKAAAAHR